MTSSINRISSFVHYSQLAFHLDCYKGYQLTQRHLNMKLASSSLFSLLVNSRKPLVSSAYAASSLNSAFSRTSFLVNRRQQIHMPTTRLFSAGLDTSILDDISITLEGPELPPIAAGSKRLFLVRHGEVINPGGDKPVYYGCQDVKLSPLGELEAKVRYPILNIQFSMGNNIAL